MNKRLQKIAELVREGMVLADIGTDHAFLPVLLMEQKKLVKAYACDVATGPLHAAETNIREAGMEDRIFPILSNGFEHVPEDANCAVIAGMGYYTIREILEAGKDRLGGFEQILIQCNTDLGLLRNWISSQHWTIEDEHLLSEHGHDYVFLQLSVKEHSSYDELECLCGPVLLKKGGADFEAYAQRNYDRVDAILKQTSDSKKLQTERVLWKEALAQTKKNI